MGKQPTRRKRQRTEDASTTETIESTAVPPTKKARNPFLPPQSSSSAQRQQQPTEDTQLLDAILRFTQRPPPKSKEGTEFIGAPVVEKQQEQQQQQQQQRVKDFDRILAYVHHGSEGPATDATVASRYDVARMVLTWSLQHVLRTQTSLSDILRGLDAVWMVVTVPARSNNSEDNNDDRTAAKASLCTSTTTDALQNVASTEQEQQQSLQRTLEHSWTPRLLGVLIDRILTATVQKAAEEVVILPTKVLTRVYPHLLTQYHPTMEVACRHVLLRLYMGTTTTTLSVLQRITRTWIATTVAHRGNPKTNFTLLATTPALLFALAEDDTGDTDNDAFTCQAVLWKLLFLWRNHGDGYRQLLLLEDSETKSSKKKPPPYPAQLLSTVAACLQDQEDCISVLRLLPILLRGFCFHTNRAAAASTTSPPSSTTVLDPSTAGTLQLRLFDRWAHGVLDITHHNTLRTSSDATEDTIRHRITCLAQMLQAICDSPSTRQHAAVRTLSVLADATAFVLSHMAATSSTTPTLMAAGHTALCCLVRLDHGLLEDGWVQALQAVLSHNGTSSTELLDLCLDTFTRLRQQGRCLQLLVQLPNEQLLQATTTHKDLWTTLIATAPLAERTAMVEVVQQHAWIAPQVLPYIVVDTPVAAQAVWQMLVRRPDGDNDDDDAATHTASFWDLQARCAFWLGCNLPMNDDDDDISMENPGDVDTTIALGCYRLRAWYGRMQEEEFHALAEDRPINEHWRTRGKALVEHLTSSHRSATRWTQLLPHIEFWLPLASDEAVDSFLHWLLVSSVETKAQANGSTHVLQDASLYQHECIVNQLHRKGLSLVSKELFQGIQRATGKALGATMTDEERINQLGNMTKGAAAIAHLPIAASFEKAIQYVDLLNALPIFLGEDEVEWENVIWLFKVDGFARSLLKAKNVPLDMEHNVLTLMAGVRRFIGRHMPLFCSGSDSISLESRLPDQFIPVLMKRTVQSLQAVGRDADGLQAVASTTARIVRLVLLSAAPQQDEDEAAEMTVIASYTEVIKDLGGIYWKTKAKVDMKDAIAILVRSILDGLQYSQWFKQSSAWSDVVRADVSEFVEALSPFALPKANAKADERPLVCNLVRYDALVLNAWKTDWLTEAPNSKLDDLGDLCIAQLEEITTDTSKSMFESRCYFAAKLAEASPSWKLAAAVAQSSTALHRDHESPTAAALLSDACYCRMIERFSDDQLIETVEKILQLGKHRGTESPVRLLRLTLQYTKVDLQTQGDHTPTSAHAVMGMNILSTALRYLIRDNGAHNWSTDVIQAASLVGELIKQRNIHTFSEFELSVVLSRINEILRSSNETCSRIFSALATLYTHLFQRYTKPMYACVANVMTVLQSFLNDAMQARDGAVREQKAQHVVRMCEGLVGHRDIYKKHIVGLGVTYVAQGGSMDDVRHDPLLPAMFYLLDAMTKYEVDQLHAFLNERSTTSLATIQKIYEKSHVFRGQ